jgi:hypothetical protein
LGILDALIDVCLVVRVVPIGIDAAIGIEKNAENAAWITAELWR